MLKLLWTIKSRLRPVLPAAASTRQPFRHSFRWSSSRVRHFRTSTEPSFHTGCSFLRYATDDRQSREGTQGRPLSDFETGVSHRDCKSFVTSAFASYCSTVRVVIVVVVSPLWMVCAVVVTVLVTLQLLIHSPTGQFTQHHGPLQPGRLTPFRKESLPC